MSEGEDYVRKLKQELMQKGLITEERFAQCVRQSEHSRQSLIRILYDSERVSEKDLVSILSEVLGYPPINIKTFIVEKEVLSLVPRDTALKYRVMPICRFQETLTVAIADPTDLATLDYIRAQTGLKIKPTLAAPTALNEAIQKYYESGSDKGGLKKQESFEDITQEVRLELTEKSGLKGGGDLSDLLEEANATPVIKLVNHLLLEAIRRHASDLFVEPWEKTMRVRIRVDGVLEEVLTTPRIYVNAVISRIKVMSRLNIAERRMPQDGRFKARIFGRTIDLRVSILPTSHGEKACLRILDSGSQAQDLDKLGFEKPEVEIIRKCASKPHGMILVTGPTGSGKTTTLYSVLQHLHSTDRNITTVEDPVEYQVQGINQVNVREQVGLTFPAALRSILRQDPDVILIGEIRDLETMDIAVKAALTGHLVLSTLHTNDASSAIVRMINMGLEPFLIASSVLIISAQRLVRKLCTTCRVPYTPEEKLLKSLGLSPREKWTFYRTKGCSHCRSTGMKGRTVITELFEIGPEIRSLIMRGASNQEIRLAAREMGMRTLRESGLEKVKTGLTTVEEIVRVTSPEPHLERKKVLAS